MKNGLQDVGSLLPYAGKALRGVITGMRTKVRNRSSRSPLGNLIKPDGDFEMAIELGFLDQGVSYETT